MDIAAFLTPDRVFLDLRVRDKSRLIAEVARQFGRLGLSPDTIEKALLARERLGSTGLGNGFALPHARIEALPAYLGLFARLAKPIEFEAVDGNPVNLVFVLLIPPETTVPHVAALAAISRRFRDAAVVTNLRTTKTQDLAYGFLTNG
jgi:PTS system nitrogen regulatory IIA component